MRRTINTARLEKMLAEAFDERHERVRERLHVDPCSDPIDEARQIEDAAVVTEQLDTVWQNRRQAQAAMERLRAGGYGVCASCGRPTTHSSASACTILDPRCWVAVDADLCSRQRWCLCRHCDTATARCSCDRQTVAASRRAAFCCTSTSDRSRALP